MLSEATEQFLERCAVPSSAWSTATKPSDASHHAPPYDYAATCGRLLLERGQFPRKANAHEEPREGLREVLEIR